MDQNQVFPLIELLIFLTKDNPDLNVLVGPIKRALRSQSSPAKIIAMRFIKTLSSISPRSEDLIK